MGWCRLAAGPQAACVPPSGMGRRTGTVTGVARL